MECVSEYKKKFRKLKEIQDKYGIDTAETDKIIAGIDTYRVNTPVVGNFSTGKSSMINAIIGKALLSVDITPETAVPTEIYYGNNKVYQYDKNAVIERKIDELPLKGLTVQTTDLVKIEYDNEFLKENNFKGSLEVVDGNTHLFLKGKSAHASQPQLGNNAASNLCHYIASVTDNSYAKFVDEYLYNDYLGEKFNVAFTGEMGALTVNLGILNYENNEGSLTLDLRLPHDSDNDELVKNVDEAVNKYGLSEEHDIGPALYVDPNSELVQKLHESYVQFTNDHEHGPQTIGGGTYAKEMPNCVAFGCEFPGKNHHMHEENELISLDDLLTAAAIYAQSLYNLLKK